jgi:hypothetical protein
LIPIITGATGTISKSLRKYLNNILERKKSTNYTKQAYWALHTYLGEYKHQNTKDITLETEVHMP